jgi:hypothetical protein
MATEDIVMVIDKPHFIVKLHRTLLEVDLKEGVKKELEDVIESKPILRESLGLLFQTIIPLDVRLRDIRSVKVDKKGNVKIDIPHRRDIAIPLKPNESKRLVEKLNELIAVEKERAIRDSEEAQKTEKEFQPERAEFEAEAYKGRAGRV